jgi:mannitol/fructose-specific phosphotransferase system IIA component (Ntr-type)
MSAAAPIKLSKNFDFSSEEHLYNWYVWLSNQNEYLKTFQNLSLLFCNHLWQVGEMDVGFF